MAALPNGEGGTVAALGIRRRIPWGVLLLFAGGIAIASAFVQSGLAGIIAGQMGALASLPTWLMHLSFACP